MKPKRLTAIVVSYNSALTLQKCIESLLNYIPKDLVSVIVVDNGSTDRSVEIARSFGSEIAIIEAQSNRGFGAGNNLGAKVAKTEYLYLHNSDAYLTADSISPALEVLDRNPSIGVAGLPLVYPDGSPQTSAYAYTSPLKLFLQLLKIDAAAKALLKNFPRGPLTKVAQVIPFARPFIATYAGPYLREDAAEPPSSPDVELVDWVTAASLIVRREVFELIQGFDEDIFLYGEDEDLCIRTCAEGYLTARIQVFPVVHEFGWGKNRNKQEYTNIKRTSLTCFARKHFSNRPLSRMLMLLLIRLKS